jgi:hypothetical protein
MPQPIDLQSELMRVTTAERIQQVAARNAQVMQQRSAAQQQQQQVEAESQVRETTQSEHGEVDPNGRPDARKRRKNKKAAPDDTKTRTFYSAAEKTEVVEDPDEHRLDISV